MKKLFIFVFVSLITMSCSKDETSLTSNPINSNLVSRKSGEVYPDYKELLSALYPEGYTLGEDKEYNYDEVLYIVSEVFVMDKENNVLKGYFVEDTKIQTTVYLNYDKEKGFLDYYKIFKGEVSKKTFDLNKDEGYAEIGFTPEMPEAVGKRKFWGWGGWKDIGDCGPQGQLQVNTHYTFWVADAHEYNYVPCK